MTTVEAVEATAAGEAEPADDEYIDVDDLFVNRDEADNDDDRRFWCQQIVTKALPLADHIAYRFMGRGEPDEDLLQVARLALLKAVYRYEREKGRFVSFAVPTVFGELRRHFRDNTWGMHVPRKYQEASLAMGGAVADMSQRMGRTPTAREVASELELSLDEYARARGAHQAYRPLSLDATIPSAGTEPRTRASLQGTTDPGYTRVEDLIVLSELVRELPSRERQILRMRFYDCLKQSEIARRLNISQVHVSRLIAATLSQLRAGMCADIGVVFAVMLVVTAHC